MGNKTELRGTPIMTAKDEIFAPTTADMERI